MTDVHTMQCAHTIIPRDSVINSNGAGAVNEDIVSVKPQVCFCLGFNLSRKTTMIVIAVGILGERPRDVKCASASASKIRCGAHAHAPPSLPRFVPLPAPLLSIPPGARAQSASLFRERDSPP